MKRVLFSTLVMSFVLICGSVGAQAPQQLDANDAAAVRAHMARLTNVDRMASKTCSAVLIGPDTALTATSCVDGLPTVSLRVFFGFHAGSWLSLRHVTAAASLPDHPGLSLLCLDGGGRAYLEASRSPVGLGETMFVAGYRSPRSHMLAIGACPSEGALNPPVDPVCVSGEDSIGNGLFRRENETLAIEGVMGDGDDLSSYFHLRGAADLTSNCKDK